jgi:asparagine synthase (glutamine-hydrolysing)
MCGIAGIIMEPGGEPVPFEDLRRMIAVVKHRGPDGYGLYRDDQAGLASARLSIVDLTGGYQPIHNEDRHVWLTFNGEIFNHVELRRELVGLGHHFYTSSDSEVIVHAYEQYGQEAWARFNGQFAFALWDRTEHRLWLVRDLFGIHPLHYARAGSSVLFGSEAKSLFASGRLQPVIDPSGVADVFIRWSAAAPSTVFAGVRAVPPATAVRFDRDLRESQHRYWYPNLEEDPDLARMALEEAADSLGARLDQAIRSRLRADVPVGAYLSGGLDSSVIASLARKADARDLQTFAIRFEDRAFDETADQRRMARLLGTEHHEILCTGDDIGRSLESVVWHCETPLLRTAPVPLFLLSGLVRESGMKVVLTGEGADELMAGYGIFKEDWVRRFWARNPDSPMLPALLSGLHSEVGDTTARETEFWRRFFGQGHTQTDHPYYSHLVRWRNTAWSARVLSPDLRAAADLDRMFAALEDEMPEGWLRWDPLARAQWIEIQTFMSSYLLSSQGDRVALAHGVEVRYPYLDRDVAEFCFGLPTRLKLRGSFDKVVLRRLAARSLPPEIWRRPKKPYRAPMTTALFGKRLPDQFEDLLSNDAIARLGLIDPRPAGHLLAKARRQHGHMSGEREEMAVVGMVTLQSLGHAFLEELPRRTRELRGRLDRSMPQVLEEDTSRPATEPGDANTMDTARPIAK